MKTSSFIELISSYIEKSKVVKPPAELTKITADSREVVENALFFCLPGLKVDGHDFAKEALKKKAAIIVGEKDLNIEKYIKVSSVKDVLKLVSPVFYDYPDRKMKMVGITGTNGKTSTAFMIENMLSDIFNCGIIGTLGYRYGGATIDAPNTTPLNWKWYSLLNDMEKASVDVVVSEVSSHAIEEERIEKTLFDIALFTNLTREHLDFHGNIENYFKAKKNLFIKHLKKNGTAIINYDDFYGKKLYEEISSSVSCIRISEREPEAELKFSIEEFSVTGTLINFTFKGIRQNLKIPYLGKHNIYNTLSALAVCSVLVGELEAVKLAEKKGVVPGRLEQIGGEAIFVDYAHTPDALENVLKTVKELGLFEKVITVFGAGGDRDKGKRPLMGEVAAKYSDIVILTDDNPRNENPDEIVQDILKGFNLTDCEVEVIRNRSEAIKKAILIKKDKDAVIVAGKGAENYQITKEGKKSFSDKKEIEKQLKELKNVYNSTD
ncbi:MAG: UDP-N-acetylmuramoyl-L-alanyl-D-glutamate--2,6-diaminopimelate ligase [bacterium]